MTEHTPTDIADILSHGPAETPAPVETVTETQPVTDNGISRDDRGRFAPKAGEPAPEPTGEKTLAAPPPVAAPSQPPEGYVPLAALVDQRLEARQAKQRLQELERQLNEARAPKQEPVDFYADPDAAFNQRINQALSPYQQQLQETRTALLEERLYRIAGSDKAPKIEEELGKAMESGDPEVQMLAHNLQTQGLRGVQALVDWYERRTYDPAAKEAELEAKILAKYGITPGVEQKPSAPPPLMPSNLAGARNVGTRAGPAWAGPTPLADIFKR